MRKILMPAAALVAIAMAFSLALAADTSKKTGVKPGDTAPSFSLQDQNGKTVSLNDFKGKIVVLEWFNDVCPFVQRHYKAGTMNDLASKWKDKDVVWLAINTTPGTSVSHNKEVVDQSPGAG
jgi:peroxiredoxin